MARKRNCRDCKKELTGKYYLITGTPFNGYEASRANYCPSCCDKWKEKAIMKDIYFKNGWSKIIEKEVGDKLMDDISEFEDKWEKNCKLGISAKNFPDNKTLLSSIQSTRQELEPYLSKPEIVEKAWEREDGDCGIPMTFFYLFSESAREKDYKQKVVQPTVEKILGGKLDEEINTNLIGHIPGFSHGRIEGIFKINGKNMGSYLFSDDCRRMDLIFWNIHDNKMALQYFLRALNIKEKELTGELPEDNRQDNNKPNQDKNNNNDNSPPEPSNKNGGNNDKIKNSLSNKPNYVLWISLSVGGLLFISFIIWFFAKKKKKC